MLRDEEDGVLFSSVESTMKESSMKVLLNSAKFGLIWQIRLLRMLLSKEGRRLFLECVFHAVHTLLCCYLDGTLLSQFFLDKPDFVKDFLCLLRTGPGSVAQRLARPGNGRRRVGSRHDARRR